MYWTWCLNSSVLANSMKPEFFKKTDRLVTSLKQCHLVGPSGRQSYYTPEEHGLDWNFYGEGNLPDDTKLGTRHASIYIDGKIGDNSWVKVAQGFVSATSLGRSSEVISNFGVIISDDALSRQSKNFTQPYRTDCRLTIVAPENKRADIFDYCVQNFIPSLTMEPRKIVVDLKNQFPQIPLHFFEYGQEIGAGIMHG